MHAARTGLAAACCLAAVLGSPALLSGALAEPAPSAGEVAEARKTVRERARALGAASAKLAAAEARLDELATRSERMVETYNGELVRLAQARRAGSDAQAKLRAAEARVEEARTSVAAIAAQSYGGVDFSKPVVNMLADQGGDRDFLHRASMMEQLSGEQGEILKNVRDAQTVAGILREQAAETYAEQQAAAERAEEAKAAAEEAVTGQVSETKRIKALKRRLETRVEAARGEAERLARERAAALERARWERESLKAWGYGSEMGDVAANWALTQLGKPYVWAADGPSSYDCSGLTMRAWERVGVRIDHWTGTQWTSGPHVPLDQLRRGDLLFFGRVTANPGDIHHVGIYVGRDLMVHAPQTGDVVRVASMWRRDLVGATRPR
ncbi:C40 family peptidase [Nonomuraea sp. NPDC046570]|uniref:C40 family peptidase n=1 Tax=Nonomuraea sp. NPDC046570 TaxID=3155255 RepID=UPI0033DC4298